MMQKTIKQLRGILNILFLVMNTLFWGILLLSLGIIKVLIPLPSWRRRWTYFLHVFPYIWIYLNQLVFRFTIPTKFILTGFDVLPKKDWVIVVANHQTWTDIIILMNTLLNRIPMLKFFMKRELIRLPIIGWACWILDFPFMHRYSKSAIKKDPARKGRDLEVTRRACEHFKLHPITVINFLEGTRFTVEKQQRKRSIYQHLLPPKVGGLALMLSTMGDYFHVLLDVTIVYDSKKINFWEYLCGNIPQIWIDIKTRPIPQEWRGDYANNEQFRIQFQRQLNQLWQEKDLWIEKIKNTSQP